MQDVKSQSQSKTQNNMSYVAHLKNTNHLKLAIKSTRIVIVKAEADWCEPCRLLRPKYEGLAEKAHKTTQFTFFTDDIDDPESHHVSKVTVVPTFFVYTDGDIVPKKIFTGDFDQLEDLVNKLITRFEQDSSSDLTESESKESTELKESTQSEQFKNNDKVPSEIDETEQISWINN